MNAYSPIKLLLLVESDGSITIPEHLREKYGWVNGVELELIEQPGSVYLQSKSVGDASRAAVASLSARIAKLNPYRGPRLSDADMHEGILETVAEKFAAR